MDLLALSQAKESAVTNQAILVYGEPKTGKTRFVGTAAKIPQIKNIYWFNLENGIDTLLHMNLTTEEMKKITVFNIKDTRESPIAIETILKAFSAKDGVTICDVHGRCDCAECGVEEVDTGKLNALKKPIKERKYKGTYFNLTKLTSNDIVVIDSGTQLGDSAMAATCLGRDVTYKPQIDDYGVSGKYLTDILSTMQAAVYCHMIMICHEIAIEETLGGLPAKLNEKAATIVYHYPSIGTRSVSMKAAKAFGTVIYLEIKLNKHIGGSSTTYKANHVTGSRLGIRLEDSKEPSMSDILIGGGVFK